MLNDFIRLFLEQLSATSIWEWCAVVLAIAYVLLAMVENIWCWPAAFISTAIYSVLFFDVSLYMESLLNIYYLLMAIYGWYQWRFKTAGEAIKPITVWSVKQHLKITLTTVVLILLSAELLQLYTDQDFAYVDSFTTWFAVITTYMVAQKVLENWLYWIVIDSVSIYLYWQKGFVLTAVLFVGYLIIALVAWYRWKQRYYQQFESSQSHAAASS